MLYRSIELEHDRHNTMEVGSVSRYLATPSTKYRLLNMISDNYPKIYPTRDDGPRPCLRPALQPTVGGSKQ